VLVADSEEDRHNKLILDDESIDNLINNKDVMHTLTFKSHPSKVLGYYPETYIHYSNRKGSFHVGLVTETEEKSERGTPAR